MLFNTVLLFGSSILFIQVTFCACINLFISIILSLPLAYNCIRVSRLILSGLLFQRKAYICFSISFIILSGGFGKDDKAYMSFGSANVFITVILLIKVSFDVATVSICFEKVSVLVLDSA